MDSFKIRCSQISKIMANGTKDNLSVGAITYLKEWYANFGATEQKQIKSKYLDKGNFCEDENIDFSAKVLGYGILDKNKIRFTQHEYIEGTPDVLADDDTVIDVKTPFDNTTFLNATEKLNKDYEWQGHGYLIITKRQKFILFYVLLDTPDEVNYGEYVSYSHIEEHKRWHAYQFKYCYEKEKQIIEKVIECRKWLTAYDSHINAKLGKINN